MAGGGITINQVMLFGRLTRDPELRYTPSGQAVTTVGLATSRNHKDASGTWQSTPEYHTVVIWGKQGEKAAQDLAKGNRLLVTGRLQTRSWDGQDGKKQYRTEVIAKDVVFLDTATPVQPQAQAQAPAQRSGSGDPFEGAEPFPGGGDVDPDDIPFAHPYFDREAFRNSRWATRQ